MNRIGQVWSLYEMRHDNILGMVPCYIMAIVPSVRTPILFECLNLDNGQLIVVSQDRWLKDNLRSLVEGRIA